MILGGLVAGVAGTLRAGSRALGMTPALPGARLGGALGGLSLVVVLFVQGFMVIATGEGLFLLAGLASKLRSS